MCLRNNFLPGHLVSRNCMELDDHWNHLCRSDNRWALWFLECCRLLIFLSFKFNFRIRYSGSPKIVVFGLLVIFYCKALTIKSALLHTLGTIDFTRYWACNGEFVWAVPQKLDSYLRWKMVTFHHRRIPTMKGVRRTHSAIFKTKVALESLKEESHDCWTKPQSSKFTQVKSRSGRNILKSTWPEIFSSSNGKGENDTVISSLYEEIGRLKVELDYLKKESDIVSRWSPCMYRCKAYSTEH